MKLLIAIGCESKNRLSTEIINVDVPFSDLNHQHPKLLEKEIAIKDAALIAMLDGSVVNGACIYSTYDIAVHILKDSIERHDTVFILCIQRREKGPIAWDTSKLLANIGCKILHMGEISEVIISSGEIVKQQEVIVQFDSIKRIGDDGTVKVFPKLPKYNDVTFTLYEVIEGEKIKREIHK